MSSVLYWTLFSYKLINTTYHITREIVITLPNAKQQSVSNKAKFDIPTDPTSTNKDLLRKVYLIRSQLDIVCRCIIEMNAAPFPYPKKIHSCKIFQLVKFFSDIQMSNIATGLDHENKVVLAVLPDLCVSVMQVLLELLRCFSEYLVLFIPVFLKLALQIFGDIGQVGGIRQHGQRAFTLRKVLLYKLILALCDTFGAGLGIENYATELIPFVISDVIPPNETITLTATGNEEQHSGKHHKKKPANQYFGGQISTLKRPMLQMVLWY